MKQLFVAMAIFILTVPALADDMGERTTLSLVLDKYGSIIQATQDGKDLVYGDAELNAGINMVTDSWIATIGACWRKELSGKWGLQRKCEKSGEEGQEATLLITIDETGKIIEVQEIIDGAKKDLVYTDSEETLVNSKIVGFNHWCWRKIRCRWRCRHSYC